MVRLAHGQLLAGRAGLALETAERALERSRQEESHGDEAWIVWLLAEIHASSDSPGQARPGAGAPRHRDDDVQ